MYSVQCTLYRGIQCIRYVLLYINICFYNYRIYVYSVHCTINSVHCTVYSHTEYRRILYTCCEVYTLYCLYIMCIYRRYVERRILYIMHCTVHCIILCMLYNVQCALYNTMYSTVHNVQYTPLCNYA